MENQIVKILNIEQVTHDVRAYRVEKPGGYSFIPGQATEVSINKQGWEEEKRPFTFTCLNEDPWLEFTIKSYHDHPGVTHKLYSLIDGDELILRDVWGAISYQGPGYFLAGGAGITPFIAIFRQLSRQGQIEGNELYYSNKTRADIIRYPELGKILGSNVHYLLTREKDADHRHGRLDAAFIEKAGLDFSKPFYICGPDQMIADLKAVLEKAGARSESLVFEK
jgi:hypothetical protein